MNTLCFMIAIALVVVLGFVSYVQLLYLESLRLIRRELPSLEYFRAVLSPRIGLEPEKGARNLSLIKHVSLSAAGLFFFCSLLTPEKQQWQSLLEGLGLSVAAMLVSTYFIPIFLYRKTGGAWMNRLLPFIRLLALSAEPFSALVHLYELVLDLNNNGRSEVIPPDSVGNIEAFITAGAEEGILEEGDRKLIHSVVAFGDKSVREVMTPRPNIVAIAAAKSIEDIRQLVIHEQYSRIPVYEESIDNIIGFIHVRDIFELEDDQRNAKSLKDLVRPTRMVPETKPVSDLLPEMQHDGLHLVIVIDEYGNTAGLATMEDLVEEILGEIRDEHEPDRDVRQEGDHVYIAPGSLDLDRLEDLLSFRPHDDTESTTVGGLATEWLGHVPRVGETVNRDGIRIEILAGNERRVEQVRVSRLEPATAMVANS